MKRSITVLRVRAASRVQVYQSSQSAMSQGNQRRGEFISQSGSDLEGLAITIPSATPGAFDPAAPMLLRIPWMLIGSCDATYALTSPSGAAEAMPPLHRRRGRAECNDNRRATFIEEEIRKPSNVCSKWGCCSPVLIRVWLFFFTRAMPHLVRQTRIVAECKCGRCKFQSISHADRPHCLQSGGN